MNRTDDPVRDIARAVLYEGYMLWPYRRSALKNRKRWNFGSVFPPAWAARGHGDDPCSMRAECLLERLSETTATVTVSLRFVQVVQRQVATLDTGRLQFVESLELAGERYVPWEEAREREVVLEALRADREDMVTRAVAITAASECEWLEDGGTRRGALVRSWETLKGRVRASSEPVDTRITRISVGVENESAWEGDSRESALRCAFASTHLVLRADGARFVSLTDPPAGLEAAARACVNQGCWPVLVGDPLRRDVVLASPIILPDFPAIAPESPGDLFDNAEINELLVLNILGLTDEEQAEMRSADPRTRAILERTRALTHEQMLRLHGTFRKIDGMEALEEPPRIETAFRAEMERTRPESIAVNGAVVRRGSRVRLRPRSGGDVLDIALEGKTAIVEGIDQDDSGEYHVAVTLEEDPGRDLGMSRHPGHRFYFRTSEIEPLPPPPRVLVAGIGNIFLGDDGFGSALARRLAARPLPPGVTVRDFGIRGMDLAYALQDCDTAILLDATRRGHEPGTLYVIDVAADADAPAAIDTHGMDPARVLALARTLGPLPRKVLVVGCEPATVPDPESDEIVGELSSVVAAAIDNAVAQVEALLRETLQQEERA